MKKLQHHSQKGTVIIVVVFIVSVIAAIAIRFASDFQIVFARAEQRLVNVRLQQALFSVEEFAAWTLEQDAENDNDNGRYVVNGVYGNYDHLREGWSNTLTAPIEDITIEAKLEDALARFNLNQLQGRPSPYNANGLLVERFTVAQMRFMRLLQTYPDEEITPAAAESITQAVIDWVDADNSATGTGGAENSYYSNLEIPYHAANRSFASVTELRQVRGVSAELYRYLEPLLVVLPGAEGLNINTALPTVMRSLNQQNIEEPLEEEDASVLTSARPIAQVQADAQIEDGATEQVEEAYASIEEFLSSNEANRIFGTDEALWPSSSGLHTGSQYFILKATARFEEYQAQQYSLLKRENTDTGVKTIVLKREKPIVE